MQSLEMQVQSIPPGREKLPCGKHTGLSAEPCATTKVVVRAVGDGSHRMRQMPMEVSMTMPSDHHTEHHEFHEPDTLWPMIWIGAALIGIVALAYAVNAVM